MIRAVRAWLAQSWPYLLVVLVFLILGINARRAVPNVGAGDQDMWGYIHPALAWLGGRGFIQSAGRDWIYPAFVAFGLKTGGSFAAVVVWQKVLGCFAGIVLALAWITWASLLPVGRPVKIFAMLCGLLPLYAQMVNPLVVYFEMQFRPEAVLGAAAFTQLACLAAYCKFRWQQPRPVWATLFGALAILLAYVCFLLKPSWLFAFAAMVLPVFVGVWGGRWHWPAPVLGIVLAVVLLWLPPRTFFVKDSVSRTFLPGTLLTIHAKLIIPSLEKRVARLPDSDPSKAKLREILRTFREQFVLSVREVKSYQTLGYNPDYLFYNSPLLGVIREKTGGTDESFRAFCMTAYRNAVIDDPLGMANKVWRQFKLFLFPDLNTFYKRRLDLQKTYQTTLESLPTKTLDGSYGPMCEKYAAYYADVAREAGRSEKFEFNSFLRPLCVALGGLALPLEILFVLALVACHFFPALLPMRLAGWVCAAFWAAPAGNAFTISIVHALDISRYRATYGPLLLFALMAMTVFIVAVPMSLLAQRLKK